MNSVYQTGLRRKVTLKSALLLAGCCVTSLFIGAGSSAQAQTATTATADDGGLETITVTARKRDEKLLDVPVAITAFTAQSIQEKAIYGLNDLANFTPGFTIDTDFNGRNDRSFAYFTIRGMVPSLSTNPTTTIFVDGTPLVSGAVDSLDDLERVEVLKGPQSAYFGKETFAGAVSLVTRDPSDTPEMSVSALVGDREYYDERVSLEGPICFDDCQDPDVLTGRISYRYYSREGSYENNVAANPGYTYNGQTVDNRGYSHLGDQSSQDININLVANLTSNLKIKVNGMYWKDDDGPSAQDLIVPSQSDCTLSGGPWFCGAVPGGIDQPAANTARTPAEKNLITALRTPQGEQIFDPINNHYGLGRIGYHGSVNIDYYIPSWGVTLTSLTGVDNSRFSTLQDIANFDGTGITNAANTYFGTAYADPYYDYPFFVEQLYRNVSEEVRITSDADQRFRYLFGANYEWTRLDTSLGGGNGIGGDPTNPANFTYYTPKLTVSGFDFFEKNPPDSDRNLSFFYGLNYDILDNLTISAEGRYAIDKEEGNELAQPKSARFEGTYHRFSPRFSLQYKFDPDLMAYATFSQGVNDGNFNPGLVTLPPGAQATAASIGAKVEVSPEELRNYEAGVKGSFFDNTVTLAADVYYDIWTDQIDATHLVYCSNDTAQPCSGGGVLEDATLLINNGESHLKGLEADATWQPIDHLDFNGSFAINDTDIVKGPCYACGQRTGTNNVNGNQLPDVSKYQATAGAQYSNVLTGDWDWFARVDYIYKSKNYEDKDNLVYAPAQNYVNLRAGVTEGSLRIEAFVTNLFNYDKATSVNSISYLYPGYSNRYSIGGDALVTGLPQLRTFGLRVNYKFGL